MECSRCLMDDSIEGVVIGPTGQCGICDAHDKHAANPPDLGHIFDQVRHDGQGRQYDAIMGISGGLDSSFLTVLAHRFGLRLLLVHFDNHFNSAVADGNMARLVEFTGYPFLRFAPDALDYGRICTKLIATGLPDADIANDLAMAKLVLDVARQTDTKWILNGHNYQYEGWNPIGWTYMDGQYLRSIAGHVPSYMDYGLLEQFTAGVKHARPFYAMPDLDKAEMVDTCAKAFGWQSYGAKHCENEYTEWVGAVYLPQRHGIDKRRNYLSADIRCGRKTKEQAKAELTIPSEFNPQKLARVAQGLGFSSPEGFVRFVESYAPSMDRSRYPSYRPMLRRFRLLVWAAAKLNLVPEAFYRKYCK